MDFRAGEPLTVVDRVLNDAQRDSLDAWGRRMLGGEVIRWWAACASLGAGLIHLAVVSEHVSEWWLYGLFFIVLGVLQVAWAVRAMAGGPLPVPRLFAAMNAAVIGLWLVTRTTGLPVGPEPWEAEAVGTADLLCSGFGGGGGRAARAHGASDLDVRESAALTQVQRRMVAVGAVAAAAVTVAALAAHPPVFGHRPPLARRSLRAEVARHWTTPSRQSAELLRRAGLPRTMLDNRLPVAAQSPSTARSSPQGYEGLPAEPQRC